VIYLFSIPVAIGLAVFLWTQFGETPVAIKVIFSVAILGILINNGRLAFRKTDR
jgi:hypothetical protein